MKRLADKRRRDRSVKSRSLPRGFRARESLSRLSAERLSATGMEEEGRSLRVVALEGSWPKVHAPVRAYMRMHRTHRERGHTCARERTPREGPRSNKFRAGKNGTGGLREIDGATRQVREREGRPVSGLPPALRSDSDHRSRKSRHPESQSARAPSPGRGLTATRGASSSSSARKSLCFFHLRD